MQLAIDLLEKGEKIDSYKNEKALPQEITKHMVYRDIVKIAGPSFIELVLTQFTSMADLMMIGGLGTWAISAISLTTQPKYLIMTMFTSLNVGTTALIARYKGMGEKKSQDEVLRQAVILTFLISVVMTVIGYFFAEPLIAFMGLKDEITMNAAVGYFRIQMLGLVPLALTSTVTAAFRGIGDSRTAMYYNTTANVVNVVLNWFLIEGHWGFPAWGVSGASIATVVGQVVAFAIAVWSLLRRKTDFSLRWRMKHFDEAILHNMLKIGIPSMIQQLFMRFGMIQYARVVATLDTVDYATHNICMNIQSMSFMIGQAFGTATTTLTGQCLGKKRVDMAKWYMRCTISISVVFAVSLMAAFLFFGEPIIRLYSEEEGVIRIGVNILKFLAVIQPFQCLQFVYSGCLSGAGDSRYTAVVIFITILIIRPGVAVLLVTKLHYGLYGAWIALAADQLLRSVLIWLRYQSEKWIYLKFSGI